MREKEPTMFSENDSIEMWFNGAADHLFELQEDHAPKHLKKRVKILKEKGIGWRMCYDCEKPTEKDARWALDEAKELLRLIDDHNGVPTCEASWK